uniref:Sec-independent protein translocase protein TATA, chloroplastic n=1 Tax=Picea sitchensis TaxID=3332 RepID=A9NKG6_PICSI|nr:unknown [Picea sitchensis]
MESGKVLMMASHSHCVATIPRPSHLVRPSGLHASSCTFFRGGKDLLCTRTLRVSRREQRGGVRVTALFGLGVPELAVIAGVAALIFGPKKLPEIGKSLGKTVKSFQEAAKEFETEVKKENEPRMTELSKPASSEATPEAEEKNVQV